VYGDDGGEKSKREAVSRGARWVMLRDETPRGFIERGRKRRKRKQKEEGNLGGMEREGEIERESAAACSALILKSILVDSHFPRFPLFLFFISLSFSFSFSSSLLSNSTKRALQRNENLTG